jgi:hypothetical protein
VSLRPALWFSCILAVASLNSTLQAADAVTGEVAALRFTSDHKLICKNKRDVLTGGDRYPDIAWCKDPPSNAPITHTGGPQVHIHAEITLSLTSVADETPYRLQGLSDEPALCFLKEGKLASVEDPVLSIEASQPLGLAVRKIRKTIAWTLTLHPGGRAEKTVALGTTGPHVVYVTLGTPRHTDDARSVVTDIRMDLTVERVAAAMKRAGKETGGPWIVYWLMAQNGDHYLPTRHYSKEKAWKVPESWEMKPKGASCVSIVEFVGLLCNMIGIEGEATTTAFYAKPPNPKEALRGGLGDPPIRTKGANNETWQLFLVDESNSNLGQVGGVGGMNYYEAALQYDLNGRTFYYPGGTNRVYDKPEKVLKIFRTLVWATWDEQVQDWVVREVVETYVKPGEKRPRSMDLP